MVLFQKLSQKYWKVFPESFKSCLNLPPLRTPIALTQKLWRNTSYLQLSGLNKWFYVVITIFAQHLNICSPKLVEWPHLATFQATVSSVAYEVGGAAAPPAWKFQGKLCFQGKLKLLKNP